MQIATLTSEQDTKCLSTVHSLIWFIIICTILTPNNFCVASEYVCVLIMLYSRLVLGILC